jgi:hypothetical protein
MAVDMVNDPELQRRIVAGLAIFCCTTLASFVLGRWWGRRQAARQWRTRQYLDRVNVTLNIFAEGWLKIRTVFERSLEEVFPNPVAAAKVRSAAVRTSAGNPILPLAPEDRWYLLNFVLNTVAERFSGELMRYDAGQALRPVTYLIFLTCEVLTTGRMRKVRAMMVRKDVLEAFPYPEAMPKLEQEWHNDRVLTLRNAAEVYRKEPSHFLAFEVYV